MDTSRPKNAVTDAAAMSACGDKHDEPESIAIIHEFLVEEGYRPVVDDDGDLRFKFEGSTYFVMLDDDPTFFRHSRRRSTTSASR